MALRPRPLIAGNWKMNGLRAAAGELSAMIAGASGLDSGLDLLICPPATLIVPFAAQAEASRIAIGAQDCHPAGSGAFTGEVSAEMLKDAGATAVIVGHSERRTYQGETDMLVADKTKAAWRAGLVAIVCVGETEAQRRAGQTHEIVGRQLAGSVPDGATPATLVVAYEPVWAIGTGLTPTIDDVAGIHRMIRADLVARFGPAGEGVRLLYGGSVKPDNAATLLAVADVNGALIGGASLKAADFLAIAKAACP